MRAEALIGARERLTEAGVVEPRRMLVDIAPAGAVDAGCAAVVLTAAAGDDVGSLLAPLVEAGVHVESVVTPAVALMSLARARRALGAPDAAEAYVALEETATCVALVRNGFLVASRELPWGYLGDRSTGDAPASREIVAGRLAEDLTRFLAAAEDGSEPVTRVWVCGGLSELRTTTMFLMERLDVEAEPLDSLFGVDAEPLAEPSDQIPEWVAAMWIAWAVAADVSAPLNLFRARRRLAIRSSLARAAVVAGVAAGLGAGWGVTQTGWWARVAAARVGGNTLPAGATPVSSLPVLKPTAAIGEAASTSRRTLDSAVRPLSSILKAPGEIGGTRATAPMAPSSGVAPLAQAAAPTPVPRAATVVAPAVSGMAPASRTTEVVPARPLVTNARGSASAPREATRVRPESAPTLMSRAATVAAPAISGMARASRTTEVVPTRPSVTNARGSASAPAREAARVRPEPIPKPFDAVLGTILYSAERRLAIVDGRIVQPGDEISGARVIDITPTAVFLNDAQGRTRSLTLAAAAR
jgi:hypothetical protein